MLSDALLSLVVALSFATTGSAAAPSFPEGPGKEILEQKCSICHPAEQVMAFSRSAKEWRETVETMIDSGADLSDEEVDVVVAYLAKNWPAKGAALSTAPRPGQRADAPSRLIALAAVTPVASHGR